MVLPLKGGQEAAFSLDDVLALAEDYPNVDVEAELRAMRGWLKANASKRKTLAGVKRFVGNWLGKAEREARERMGKLGKPGAGNAVGGQYQGGDYTQQGLADWATEHHHEDKRDGHHDHGAEDGHGED